MIELDTAFADAYDVMIDWTKRLEHERPFFEQLLQQQPIWRVLDVGAATGHHSRLFAALGAKVIGLDPNPAMLRRARELTRGVNPHFIEGGFDGIPQLKHQFDLITALGNTLAYVRDTADLTGALQAIHDALTPSGCVCLQVINYNKLQADGTCWLHLLSRQAEGCQYLFLREHRLLREDRSEFTIITLMHDAGWRQHVERSVHLPLTCSLLESTLRQVGFTQLACYGDYAYSPFDPQTSPALIVTAAG